MKSGRTDVDPGAVAALLSGVAQSIILPRYRKLKDGDIATKAPGELVTIADKEAELVLADGLTEMLPGSIVVGEESAASIGDIHDLLRTAPSVWLVDPLDGTANFVKGQGEFAVMVALIERGQAVASWILHPLSGDIAIAERGGGAFWNGQRIRTSGTLLPAAMRGAILKRFLPAGMRQQVEAREAGFAAVFNGSGCAGQDYPQMALGHQHFTLYWRTEPWDHVPGILFLEEAGGRSARPDGTPYQPSERGEGLLAVYRGEAWEDVARVLFNDRASLAE